jgi:hypothetical protein
MGPYSQVVKEVKTRAHGFFYVDFAHESSSNVDAYKLLARSMISFVTGSQV